jgi:hypothetical protein
MIFHSNKKTILSFNIIVFSSITIAVVSCVLIFSCTAGVNIGEADKILETFDIEWPAGLNETCDMDTQIWITISARDQNNDILNLNDAVEILLTNNYVSVDPRIILLTNGSANIQVTFNIFGSLEDEQTDVLVRYEGRAYEVCTLLVINTLKPVINVKQVDTTPSDIPNGGGFDYSDIVMNSNMDIVFLIENNGTADLELEAIPADRVVLSGVDASAFSVQEQPDDQIIIPGNDTPFTLRFNPDEVRIYRAEMTIQNNDIARETYTINLIGQGAAKLTDFPGAADDLMGFSVSMSGNNTIVGAYYDDDNGTNSGSAYLFIREEFNWGEWNGSDSHWDRNVKLTADDGASNDYFGYAVAVDGDNVVVGAPGDDDGGDFSGSVYVFNKDQGGVDNWGQLPKLTASDGQAYDYFGGSVAISGDRLIIGAPEYFSVNSAGAAYIFHWNGSGWVQQQKLTPSENPTPSDFFGCSVSISGDYAIVGANRNGPTDFNMRNIGMSYIYHWNGSTWTEQQVLYASDYQDGDDFGKSVSILGDVVIIGAPYDDDNGNGSGSAYIFKRDGSNWGVWNAGTSHWDENHKITASDGAASHYFGYSVSMYVDSAVIGAPGSINSDISTGFAYIFSQNGGTWTEQKKLVPSDGFLRDGFGWSVSMSSSYVLVGARSHDIDVSGNGSIESTEENIGAGYIFYWDGSLMSESQKLVAGDIAEDNYYGYCVSVDGDYAIVGATDASGIDTWTGAAYILHWNGSSWVQQQKLSASDGVAYDDFGFAVAISGDYAIIGARNNDTVADAAGAAFIFRRNGSNWGVWNAATSHWDENQKLTASDGVFLDNFGHSVAIDGDYAVIGAIEYTQNGYVYIFERNGSNWGVWNAATSHWDENQKMNGTGSERFGAFVSVDGDYTAIGGEDSVYVYYRSGGTWGLQQELTPGGGSGFYYKPVSLAGDRLLIGNRNGSISGFNSGAASVFTRSGTAWTETSILFAGDGAEYDEFGSSVSLSVDYAVVGAWHEDDGGNDAGSAYLFYWNGDSWIEKMKLYASDADAGDLFGHSVSISGDQILVGAYEDDVDIDDNGTIESNEEDTGSVYFYSID